MASSTEEVSAPDLSLPSDSRKEREDNADHFGTVFKDFDFLEYESESVEVSVVIDLQAITLDCPQFIDGDGKE